jgi:hypothetical protein
LLKHSHLQSVSLLLPHPQLPYLLPLLESQPHPQLPYSLHLHPLRLLPLQPHLLQLLLLPLPEIGRAHV